MRHAGFHTAVKLLIRPVTPTRAGADNPIRTSPYKDTTVSQNPGHAPSHQPHTTTNAMAAPTHSQSDPLLTSRLKIGSDPIFTRPHSNDPRHQVPRVAVGWVLILW